MVGDTFDVSIEALGLRDSETHFFRSLVESSGDAIISIDESSRILYANRAVEHVLGYEPEALLGDKLTVLMPDELSIRHLEAFERYLETGDRTVDWDGLELPARHSDGHEVPLSITFEEHSYNGQRIFSGIMRDISDAKARERQLRQQKREITMLERIFSRVFRHNIRNKLTVATGHLELLDEQLTDTSLRASVTAAHNSIDRLVSHAEKTRQIERVVETDPATISRSVQTLVADAIDPFENELHHQPEISVEDVSVSVIDGFQTAVETAIENAIEHNPAPVSLAFETTVTDDRVDLWITDDGEGIPEHEVAVLTDEHETALSHGSGVGLWLMKWYVEGSGGDLEITGTDSGTEIRMRLLRGEE